jgi:hypothetical protein
MKLIAILITVSVTFFGISQVSYDFSAALPPLEEEAASVDRIHFGIYNSEETNSTYEFNEKGICIISTTFTSVSREMVRENSKYTVRNGFIFGVTKDSLPCVLEEDRFHFGILNKEYLIGSKSRHILKKVSNNQYFLNYEENGNFVPTLLTFNGKQLTVQQFDYETGTSSFNEFKAFTSLKKDGIEFVTISPSREEWQKFNFESLIFGKGITYLKQ